ncbi:MAG: class I SAM-dependent methyltransferase [Bacteroidetes bacterium]|nr:class I SAM-dependent methyltransferase [Bacteroidota bacterium]
MEKLDWLAANRDLWNSRVKGHMNSDFYAQEAFEKGACSLKQPELALLGDVRGKEILHLQCHFGQDTLSLQRRGAQCTGLDFSNEAIEAARVLNAKLGLGAEFVCEEVYKAAEAVMGKPFDAVFTSYGTLGWLPDVGRWAEQVAACLKPGGELVYVDFHPFLWTLNSSGSEFAFDYFNREAIVETSDQSYASTEQKQAVEVGWNHPVSEIQQALIDSGLQLEKVQEFDYSPYNCLANLVEEEPGVYRWSQHGNRFPMLLAVRARKR